MKLWKKIALILLAVLLLAQIPFIYQRFQKQRLAEKITALAGQETRVPDSDYQEFTGVIHVHTVLGEHSTGSFNELLEGAQENGLDFVVLTEHTSPLYDTSAMTFRGFQQGILFIAGNEMDTENQDRFLLLPGSAQAEEMTRESTGDFLSIMHSQNKLAVITYPERFKSWNTEFDGIEVFNMNTNARKMNAPYFFFDALWSYGTYPQLTLATYLRRPDENLEQFDRISTGKKIALFGGADAHSNIGFHLFGDDTGKKLLNLKFDRYSDVFRLVRQHVLIEKGENLSEKSLLEALKGGHSFIGFDVLSRSRGFFFAADNGREKRIMGDRIELGESVRLHARAPQKGRFVLFRNGHKAFESGETTEINWTAEESGVYRIEVYLDALGEPFDRMPWIISNPIYIK
ncbi:MAG: hypothetical protein R2747_25215 [Pyrinomonadaceae bacterium]